MAIDCKSRYDFVWCYRSIASQATAELLKQVIADFPFAIVNINTDNGSEYLLNFHKACIDLGITPYFTHPYTPKMNRRAERLIKTAIEEFFNYQYDMLPELEDINAKCVTFNDNYNTKRYHAAIGHRLYELPNTGSKCYKATVTERKPIVRYLGGQHIFLPI